MWRPPRPCSPPSSAWGPSKPAHHQSRLIHPAAAATARVSMGQGLGRSKEEPSISSRPAPPEGAGWEQALHLPSKHRLRSCAP